MTSLGYPGKFLLVPRLGSVTARHSSSVHQPNFAALNRERHLYWAGRPSRWALAHILVLCVVSQSSNTAFERKDATSVLALPAGAEVLLLVEVENKTVLVA